MKKTLVIFLITVLSGGIYLNAQPDMQRMTNYLFTTADGLSSTKITCLLQDKGDFMWIGTEDGLNRFNGHDFTVYKKEFSDSLSLISNHIIALFQDSRKRIWVATIAGLEYYDLDYNGFINVSLNLPDHIVKKNQCMDIAEDNKGNLWFASTSYGVVRYSPETEKSRLFSVSPDGSSIASNFITTIVEDKNERMWFGSQDNGISVYDPNTDTFQNFNTDNSPLTSNSIFDLDLLSNGDIIISTMRGGVIKYDSHKKEFVTYNDVFNEPHTRSIFSSCEDAEGNILVGTEGNGVYIFDPIKRTLTQHPVFKELSDQIGETKVSLIYKGNFTYIWTALTYKGVFVTGYEKSGFKSLTKIKHEPNSLNYGSVTGITTDIDKNVWIATDGGGLSCYNIKTQIYTHYKYNPDDKQSISDNSLKTVFCDSRNRIWVGTYSGGLCLLNRDNGTFTRFRNEDYPDGLQINFIKSIQEDKRGFLWLGTNGGGLVCFDPEKKQFRSFKSVDHEGLNNDYILKLLIDSKDRLWIGTTFGLSCMDLYTEIFTDFSQKNGLVNFSIYALAEDNSGSIWIGTSDGLGKFNPDDSTFIYKYPLLRDYYSPVVNGIVPDGDDLWLSTNNGIVKYTPDVKGLKRYFANSGLQSNEFIMGSYHKSRDGEIFFGGVEGLNAFFSKDIYDNDLTPKVYITNLRIFNESVSINEKINGRIVLSRNIEVSKKITLQQSDKNFTLEFIAMGVFDPYATIYSCKMEGFDKEWIKYDYNHRSITYTNLSPGTYTFRVKASSNPDIWGEADTSLIIVIEPALWNTWWAKLGYMILAGFLLFILFRLLIIRVREKNELKLERLRISQEKEINEAKTNFFMNITHEFRTPLTLIIGPLERLVAENNNETREKIGQLILRNVSRLQRLINQILDMNKIEEQKMLLHVEQIELVSFVSHTISAFNEITKKKNVELLYTCKPHIINIWYDPDMLDKALNNLLYNAYKFTMEGGQIHVDIHVDEEGVVYLTVKDTGIGMDEATVKYIFERFAQGRNSKYASGTGIGMNLTKSIIDLHKGSIKVESQKDVGTTIVVTILPGSEHFSSEELVPSREDAKLKDVTEQQEEGEFMNDPVFLSSSDNLNEDLGYPGAYRPLILLVEDDNDMRFFVKQELEQYYRVEEAVNGKIGLELASKIMPDLIITDVMMPEMDGIELTHLLKTSPETSHIPVILLTAQGNIENRLEGLESGADSYIPKPFSLRHLKIRIRKLIELRQVMKERFSKSINMEAQEIAVTSNDEKLLQNAIDYVRKNIENTDLSVEGMSKHLGLSRTHLHRKLKALTGESPVDFIKMIRMKQAAYLLSTGKLSISEVGYKVGYNTPSYFSSSFNAYFGMSPTAYMEKSIEKAGKPENNPFKTFGDDFGKKDYN